MFLDRCQRTLSVASPPPPPPPPLPLPLPPPLLSGALPPLQHGRGLVVQIPGREVGVE